MAVSVDSSAMIASEIRAINRKIGKQVTDSRKDRQRQVRRPKLVPPRHARRWRSRV